MYVSVRDAIIRSAGFPTLLEGLKYTGLRAFELEVGRDMAVYQPEADWDSRVKLDTPHAVFEYRRQLEHHGIMVSALLLGNDFSRSEHDAEIDWVAGCAHVANEFEADAVRIDAVMSPEDPDAWPLDRRIAVFADSMKKVLAATQGLRPQFGIENHGWPGNDPEFLSAIINAVGSPRLGNTLDTANFYWSGFPISEVYAILERFAPSTKHVHMKNIAFPSDMRDCRRERGWGYDKYCCPVLEGDIDMRRLVVWLKKAGYRGDLCIENESLGRYTVEERQQMIRGEAEFLNGLI